MKNWLLNPFVFVAGSRALGIGLGIIAVTSVVAWLSGTHFDGVIDAHLNDIGSWQLYALEGLTDWLCATIIFYFTGRLLSRSSIRFVDVAGTMALARFPMFFAAFAGFLPVGDITSLAALNDVLGAFLVATVILLVCIIWMIALMFNAFTVSCNVKGGKAVGGFIAGLLVAEVLSKFILFYLNKSTLF